MIWSIAENKSTQKVFLLIKTYHLVRIVMLRVQNCRAYVMQRAAYMLNKITIDWLETIKKIFSYRLNDKLKSVSGCKLLRFSNFPRCFGAKHLQRVRRFD